MLDVCFEAFYGLLRVLFLLLPFDYSDNFGRQILRFVERCQCLLDVKKLRGACKRMVHKQPIEGPNTQNAFNDDSGGILT